jgi:hypothetical protein
MTKFRITDPVRITSPKCRYFDRVGTVTAVVEGQDHPFHVSGLEPWALWFGAGELVLAENPIERNAA